MSGAPGNQGAGPEASGHWEREYRTTGAAQTQELARRLGEVLRPGDLLTLSGELGAGKTTFTQGLGEGLGVRPGIISPTFVLVRIHPALGAGPDLVHVDAYRLGSPGEIDDIDLENTMDTSVTVVEWGQGMVEHLAESRLEVTLLRATGGGTGDGLVTDFSAEDDDEERTIRISGYGPRWTAAPDLAG